MRLISCRELESDMQLARSVYMNGCIYLQAGLRDLQRYKDRLDKLGIFYVYVTDRESQGIEVQDVVREGTRETCKSALIATFNDFENKGVLDSEKIAYPVHCIMKDILDSRDVQISLSDISISDEYIFGHSVSTAVYAALIGLQLGYSDDDMNELVTAALLHDIGKTRLNGNILNKEGKLDDKEFEYMRQHPAAGYEALKKTVDISERVKLVALNHHERLDGSGYPRGLTEQGMDEFSKIVAVADVYDALTSTRSYRPKWKLNEAAEFLSQRAGSEFDMKCVSLLLKRIAMFPNGTKVWLSDDRAAIVKSQNPLMPHCPVVRVIEEHGHPVVPYDVNLSKNRDVFIVEY